MLRLVDLQDFTIVVPDSKASRWIRALMEEGRKANQEYLESLQELPTGGHITGSFIYAHPPDYVGRPTLDYGVSEWRQLFAELAELGIDTVIYQASAWVEMRECYYPSAKFSDYRSWNALDPLIEATAAEGMTLYLGGLGSLSAFDEQATAETLDAERDAQLECFRELMAYRGGFHGFYMSPETGFPGQRQPAREKMLNRFFSQVCQGVKELIPDIPILMSPCTYYIEGMDREIRDFLYNLFAGCPVDYIAPQDSIGTFGNRLPHLQQSFEIWRQVCDELGVKLWVNVESFERVKIGTSNDFVPADFNRLRIQLANAAQFDKIISWEVPYFYSPLAGEQGQKLRAEYADYLRYTS